jgi:hypothetical protein
MNIIHRVLEKFNFGTYLLGQADYMVSLVQIGRGNWRAKELL